MFAVDQATKEQIEKFVVGGAADEGETLAMIAQCYAENGYVLDTHTAVALKVSREYRARTKYDGIAVIDSTAHPCKFVASVLTALNGQPSEATELQQLYHQLKNVFILLFAKKKNRDCCTGYHRYNSL